jgi:hypothetical protein
MGRAIAAGLTYFAVVFAFAFALGAIRVFFVAPRLGETAAVLLELPLVLAASWWTCGELVRRFRVGSGSGERLAMGGIAFAVLMAAEALLAILAFGRTPEDYLGDFATPAGALGLAGQAAFALIPLVRGERRSPI